MPFMAAIVKENWDGKWTPYAGVLSMEIYKLKAGSFGVRMLFQGKPVHIPECSDSTWAVFYCYIDRCSGVVGFRIQCK